MSLRLFSWHSVHAMLEDNVKQTGLEAYLYSRGAHYATVTLQHLASAFDLPLVRVRRYCTVPWVFEGNLHQNMYRPCARVVPARGASSYRPYAFLPHALVTSICAPTPAAPESHCDRYLCLTPACGVHYTNRFRVSLSSLSLLYSGMWHSPIYVLLPPIVPDERMCTGTSFTCALSAHALACLCF